ncbi:hypothetical protein BDY21DRAFT_176427 [Lineolata rhizophorae]|uniref:G-protein coupled receptors family 2 profile 2 domain-containing protein n=1 Tax=Lineolata rhizophorae TaxID=578093 RepID=A0A6A6P7H4_9PEZI|nr:hypothetical protein BDY21DRAFT_176427 [Lineolata rhizophorae]
MANLTELRGACPPPFLDVSQFSVDGGFTAGRFCAPTGQATCCLPCPATDWIYPRGFVTWYKVAESINGLGLALCLFLLISYMVLPIEKTRRHYLSVCLIIGVIALALGFVIPLGVQPPQCYDEITPNDMYTSLTCAWSGAFIIAGGLAIDVWIFIRALSMHLQICWDVQPGKKFFYVAQGLGWGVIATLFTATITVTGVSFRFGDACHVNSENSMKDFWGPLLAIAGLSTIVQLATFGYCINVYIKNLWSDEKTETTNSSGLPSYTSSLRMQSARAVYRRVRKVVWLQWRGIMIVVFILVDVIFFSIVFVYLDSMENAHLKKADDIEPWVTCLVLSGGDKEACTDIAQKSLVNQPTVVAILLMLALAGVQCFLLLARLSMFSGWYHWFKEKTVRKNEFVSLDAASREARTYELLKVGSPTPPPAFSPSTLASPPGTYSPAGRNTPDYFGKDVQREYRPSSMSFSAPRPPSSQGRLEVDLRSAQARGGLGLHPPVMESREDVMSNKI